MSPPFEQPETTALAWWQRLARHRLLEFAVVALALASVARLAWVLPSRATENDFAHYYVTSRMVWEGKNPYVAPLAPEYARYGLVFEKEVGTATNPPPLQWWFLPWALLPPRVAWWGWLAAQVVCLGVVLGLTRRLLRGRLNARGWRFVCAGAVLSATVYWHFYYSQMQLLLAALVLAAYCWYRTGRPTAAGVTVTVASLLKLYPLALLPWFVWGRDHSAGARVKRAVMVAALAIVVVVLTGPSRWVQFFQVGVPSLAADATNRTFNFNLPALVANLGCAAYHFSPPPEVARTWWVVGSVLGGLVLLLVYGGCWRSAGRDPEAEFCLLCIAMLIASGKASGTYLVFVIFPMAVAAARLAARPSLAGVIFYGGLLVALNDLDTRATPFLDRHLYGKIFVNYIPLYGLVALGIFFANELRRSKTVGAAR